MKYTHFTFLALAFSMSVPAFGANRTWNGNTSADWATSANWDSAFVSGDKPIFGVAGSSGTTLNNNLTAGTTVAGMTFNGGGSAFTINGNAINLTNIITLSASAASQIINLDMSMSATRTMTLSGAGANLTLGGVISGTGGLIKGGTAAATLFLNGSNSFSGEFSTNGVTSINTLTDAGSNSSIGTNGIFQLGNSAAGSLYYTGATTSTNRQVKIGTTTATQTFGGTLLNNGSGAMTFTNGTFNVAPVAATVTRVLSLGGSSTATNEIQGVIQDNNTGGGGLISVTLGASSFAGGTWKLSGPNTYTGITTISYGGVLEATTLANGGANSSIGASGNAATNLVFGTNAGILRYVGSAHISTDRAFTFSGSGTTYGNGMIESSGAGTLSFTDSSVTLAYGTANQGRNLVLGGTNPGNNTFGKVLANNGTGACALRKSGTGKWILTGANTYTGATVVNDGTLVVGSGGTLGGICTSSVAGIQMLGGNLDLGGTTKTMVGLGGVSITGGTGDVIANGTVVNAANYGDSATTVLTISANLQGAGGYNKAGPGGITTLTGTNTYSGGTIINGGKLLVNGSLSGNIDLVASGATLGGTGSIGGTASVDGKISPGAPGVGTLQVTGSVTWNAPLAAGADTDWVFDLSTPAADLAAADAAPATACDRLAITGSGSDFIKPLSAVFRFDFGGYAGANGWFKLVEWDDTTDFVAADFSSTNLGAGKSAAFTVDATTKALYVEITGSGPTGYALWQQNNGATGQASDLDHDGDGVDNGVEYFVGGTTGFTALPGIVGNSVTWPKDAAFLGTYGTTYKLQTSTTLTGWADVPDTDPKLINTGSSVGYNLLPPTGASLFVRLVVTP